MKRGRCGAVLLAATILCQAGCSRDDEANLDTSQPTDFGYQVSPQTMRLMEGKLAYEIYCLGCHGVDGDGAGEGGRVMQPRPRDFQKGAYKFISTRFGELPTDEDLFRTISNGLRGSAMPAWGHLPEETRHALVAYIKTFSDVWELGETAAIPFVTDPYVEDEDKSAAIARGEMAYHGFFMCWNCHPAYVDEAKINTYLTAMGASAKESFRPGIGTVAPKTDSNNETIFAPDFLRDYVKSGLTVRDLYRTVGAGITGTAMPTWVDTVADDVAPRDADGKLLTSQADIWAIAYYLQDLMKQREVMLPADQVLVRADRKVTIGAESTLYDYQVGAPVASDADGEEFVEEEEFFEEDE